MKLSIIITHYNKDELLVKALESVQYQLKSGDEIIVVDDCSTDAQSLNHIYELEKVFTDIKFIFNQENQGASEAKNIAIKEASNEVIVLLDADDTLPDDTLNKIHEAFELHPDIDILFGNYYRYEMEENTKELIDCRAITKNKNSIDPSILVHTWLLLGTSPFKKALHEKLCGFDKLYPRTDDRDFHIKAILYNAKFYYIDYPIYNWHRYSNGNNSNIPQLDSAISYFRNILFYYNYSQKIRFLLVLIKNTFRIIFLKLTR